MIRSTIRASLFIAILIACNLPLAIGHTASPPNGRWPQDSEAESKSRSPHEAVGLSVQFLRKSQAQDGGWHAQQYGTMKQGAAVTSLVLYALSHLSDQDLKPLRDSKSIEKAASFIKLGLKRTNSVSNPEGSLDFPVYSTALILTAHKRIGLGLTDIQIKKMVEYLQSSQCAQRRGFKPTNQNFGGWDILGPGATSGRSPGANVSVTFYVLEALSHYPHQKNEEVLKRARIWCDKIANNTPKGGFYFTSQLNSTLNKAGQSADANKAPLAYGSATCDGLGILLLTGSELKSTSVSETVSWLKSRQTFSEVPGFPKPDESGWSKGLQFYYLAALSRCVKQWSGNNEAARRGISNAVCKLQLEDGSWKNKANQMREDESLIATSFALIALGNNLNNSN